MGSRVEEVSTPPTRLNGILVRQLDNAPSGRYCAADRSSTRNGRPFLLFLRTPLSWRDRLRVEVRVSGGSCHCRRVGRVPITTNVANLMYGGTEADLRGSTASRVMTRSAHRHSRPGRGTWTQFFLATDQTPSERASSCGVTCVTRPYNEQWRAFFTPRRTRSGEGRTLLYDPNLIAVRASVLGARHVSKRVCTSIRSGCCLPSSLSAHRTQAHYHWCARGMGPRRRCSRTRDCMRRSEAALTDVERAIRYPHAPGSGFVLRRRARSTRQTQVWAHATDELRDECTGRGACLRLLGATKSPIRGCSCAAPPWPDDRQDHRRGTDALALEQANGPTWWNGWLGIPSTRTR